jgi:hypothetical protein
MIRAGRAGWRRAIARFGNDGAPSIDAANRRPVGYQGDEHPTG